MLGQPLPVCYKQLVLSPISTLSGWCGQHGNHSIHRNKQRARRQRGSPREAEEPRSHVIPLSCECPLGVTRRQRAYTNGSMSWPLLVVRVVWSDFKLRPLGCCRWVPYKDLRSDDLRGSMCSLMGTSGNHINGTTQNHKSPQQHRWGLPLVTKEKTCQTVNGWKEFLLRTGISSLDGRPTAREGCGLGGGYL